MTWMFGKGFLAAAVLFAVLPAMAADTADALIRLLNSRASGSPRTYAEAAEEVAAAAKEGSAVPAFVIAVLSRDPATPPAARLDDATRTRYLEDTRGALTRLARERNNAMAWYLLSLEANDTNLLHRAADAGNVQAQNAWGALLFSKVMSEGAPSNVVARVLKESAEYFKKAAGTGDANGLYNLGMCHARGLGVEKNDSNAFNCFRTAAEQGHPEAINNIGWFFREGRVVGKDLGMSVKWFEKSASYGNAFGQFNYALALQRGEGVEKDVTKAATLMKAAAEGGCVEAIDAYAVALCRGNGVEKNETEAFRLFHRAADAGYPPAMENVAACYEKGMGITPDKKKAIEWKIRSRAARGDRNAAIWLQQNAKGRR